MGALVMAWLVGEGILIYRTAKIQKAPPGPGQLLYTSGIFVLLALIAQSENARPFATLLAWGFDIAAFMHLFDNTIQDTKTGGTWPPPLLPDNVVFPTQKSGVKPSLATPVNPPLQV